MTSKILERIPNLPIIAICIAVLLGTITGMLFFMSADNKRDTLKYLEKKYEETFVIQKELSYDEYLDITKENNISEEDFVFAYIVESKGSPDQSFVVGQYKGSMSHFFSPVPEKVWFDTYDEVSGITHDDAELILKYLENKYDEDFICKEKITNTLAMPDEHGHLEVVEDIRSAYLFSPMNNKDIEFAAGIKNTNAERFDFYGDVVNSKPIIPPYCN